MKQLTIEKVSDLHVNVSCLLFSIIFFMLVCMPLRGNELLISHSIGVPESTEHNWMDSPNYNEKNHIKLYSLSYKFCDSCNEYFQSEERYVTMFGGHMINSYYDFTEINGVNFSQCVGYGIQICGGIGAIGFRGYNNTKDMLDGFSYVTEADLALRFNFDKYVSIDYKYMILIPAMVSTEVVTFNIKAKI